MYPLKIPKSAYASQPIKSILRNLFKNHQLPYNKPEFTEELDRYLWDSLDKKQMLWLDDYKEMDQYYSQLGVKFVFFWDNEYPILLREIPDPPFVLFVLGDINYLKYNWWAVVGTRKASIVSLFATQKFVERCVPNGVGLVSGVALGIDREAMLTAINHGIPTIGVIGTSLDKEYPYQNRDIYKLLKTKSNTLIISEYLPNTNLSKWTFPMRNRIITGIAEKVFIMESPLKSGAMSSANSAIQQNKEIWIFDHVSLKNNSGGKSLINDGANILQWEDIWPGSNIISFSYPKEFWVSKLIDLMDKNIFNEVFKNLKKEDIPNLNELKFLSLLKFLESKKIVISLGNGYFLWLE